MSRIHSRHRWIEAIGLSVAIAATSCDSTPSRPPDSSSTPSLAADGRMERQPAAVAARPAGTPPSSDAPSHKNPAGGQVPVQLQLLDFGGIEKLIASHRGKVVVLDAWSTACPPCIQEFPRLVELHRKHATSDLACISLSFDYEGLDPPEQVRPRVLKFLQKQQATFDNVLSTVESLELLKKMAIPSLPAVLVYDRQGRLVRQFGADGEPFSYTDVEALLADLL